MFCIKVLPVQLLQSTGKKYIPVFEILVEKQFAKFNKCDFKAGKN